MGNIDKKEITSKIDNLDKLSYKLIEQYLALIEEAWIQEELKKQINDNIIYLKSMLKTSMQMQTRFDFDRLNKFQYIYEKALRENFDKVKKITGI